MKTLIVLAVIVFILLFAAWGAAAFFGEAIPGSHAAQYAVQIENIGRAAWDFLRPLLQLMIVLLVLQWFLEKRGIQISFSRLGLTWDARLLVALIVIFTFCLVSLSGMEDRGIKEAALVVIGFYFGSAKTEKGPTLASISNTHDELPPPKDAPENSIS